MLLKENGIAGRRDRSQPKEKNRRANESSFIAKTLMDEGRASGNQEQMECKRPQPVGHG
jgi:hypothetical protein